MNEFLRSHDDDVFAAGKLPYDVLTSLLSTFDHSPEVVLGPGIGRDVAIVDTGMPEHYLVLKSDPITFATERLGWYAVTVCANDLATVGADPRWYLATILLPTQRSGTALIRTIMDDLQHAAREVGAVIVGGHTEVTDVPRAIVSGTMIGMVRRDAVVWPNGLRVGDTIVLTGGMAIESTSIVARELPDRLRAAGFTEHDIAAAAEYLVRPGIGVTQVSRIARGAARIRAMHDPTEGGVVTALDELAAASGVAICVDTTILNNAISPLSRRVCDAVGIDPRGAISSGGMLIGLAPDDAKQVIDVLQRNDIDAWTVATVVEGATGCRPADRESEWPRFAVDEIARLFHGN